MTSAPGGASDGAGAGAAAGVAAGGVAAGGVGAGGVAAGGVGAGGIEESRRRIQAASDQRRQAIEKELHAGAQQHLVALAVKLGLAEVLVREEPDSARELLRELRHDVQEAIGQLRELAHRIYPALLRDRGLGEALQAEARRTAVPCTVKVSAAQRYPHELETAVYFACVDAVEGLGTRDDVRSMSIRVQPGRGAGSVDFTIEAALSSLRPSGGGAPAWLVAMEDRLAAADGKATMVWGPGRLAVRGRIPAAEMDAA